MSDILDEMTKSELIYFIRMEMFGLNVTKSELLSHRWEIASEANLKKLQEHGEKLSKIDFKRRDRLAVAFNESKDNAYKLSVLKEISKIDDKYKAWKIENDRIGKEMEHVDEMYAAIDKQRERERGGNNGRWVK